MFQKKDSAFTCRLAGKEILVDETVFSQALGLEFGGEKVHVEASLPEFDIKKFWSEVAKPDATKDTKRAEAEDFSEDSKFYMYKFISHVVLGKKEANKISKLELALLWCAREGILPCIPSLIISAIEARVENSKKNFGYGPLITALAVHAGVDVRSLGYMLIRSRKVLLIPRALKVHKPKKRKASAPLPLDEGPSKIRDKGAASGSNLPLEGWASVLQEIRANQESNIEFQAQVIDRLDRNAEATRVLQVQQVRDREASHKEFKALRKLLLSCTCVNKDALVDDEASGNSEQAGEGQENVQDVGGMVGDVHAAEGPRNEHVGIENEVNQGAVMLLEEGGDHNVEGPRIKNSDELVGTNQEPLILDERGQVQDAVDDEEELNEEDDIDSDDLIEAGNEQVDHGRESDDYIDTSRPMGHDDDEESTGRYKLLDEDDDSD